MPDQEHSASGLDFLEPGATVSRTVRHAFTRSYHHPFFVLCGLGLAACGKDAPSPTVAAAVAIPAAAKANPPPAGGIASAAPNPAPKTEGNAVDKSKFKACVDGGFDCPRHAGCSDQCAKDYDAQGNLTGGHCLALAPGAPIGASPCYGQELGNRTSFVTKNASSDRGVICDANRDDSYCEVSTHTCTKAKAIGEPCNNHDECGKNGECYLRHCAQLVAIGASCAQHHCVWGAKCDSDKRICVKRKPRGAACKKDEDCESFWCKTSPPPRCRGSIAAPREVAALARQGGLLSTPLEHTKEAAGLVLRNV